ncbi:hypothetical protein V0U79_05015 [Hyphobacterium sp. HN65]|uniref:Uncharacterized protein n=1 Tax=Hyphobacterium lacteum TaxID=3116575 RepID=A0ABU7LPB2_9PROT|nr:hypothetical protein [Hyphobacterium sp. HN65]MEE2525718.1 hypothetical protein [Hyphobacterium sp. HN65]
MMRFLLSVLAAMLLLSASTAAQQRLVAGEVTTLRLDDAGEALVRIDLDHAAAVELPVFAGPETVQAVFITPNGDTGIAPAQTLVLPAGRHQLAVSGGPAGEGETVIQVRPHFLPPNDAFEPNDTPETAREVELPFHQVVRLSHGDWDWFQVDPGRRGILGVHLLANRGGHYGPQIRVVDADGVELYLSPTDQGGWNGMRYVRVDSGPVFVGVTDSSPWADQQPDGFKALEIVRIEPMTSSSGRLITLSLETDDPSFFQLGLVGDALGMDVRAADEADRVATELAQVVRGEGFRSDGRNWIIWLIPALALASAIAGGVIILRKRRRAKSD